MRTLLTFLLLLSLAACYKPTDGFYEYKCKAGEHKFSGYKPDINHTYVCFDFYFDSSCEQSHPDEGINKLLGQSESINHHKHSIRIGWRWKEGRYQILPYIYKDGAWTREITVLGTMRSNEVRRACVGVKDNQLQIDFDGTTYTTERSSRLTNVYRLWSYFGGQGAAEKDMQLYIRF